MIFKNRDISLYAGNVELITIPYSKLSNINFPEKIENINEICIDFYDCYVHDKITIEFTFSTKYFQNIIIEGGDICYHRLFEFLDETDPTEHVSLVSFKNYQLSFSLMQKLSGGYARLNPSKPVVRSYQNGKPDIYEFMRIDNCYTFTDYTHFPQWKKPRILYFNENGMINESSSKISFVNNSQTYLSYETFKIDHYLNILHQLTGKIAVLNYDIFEFEFKDALLSPIDEIMIELYFFFDYHKAKKNITLSNREELFSLTNNEKTLLHMQFIC